MLQLLSIDVDEDQRALGPVGTVGTALCLAVVKDGRLVYDRTFYGFAQTHGRGGFESMACDKTFTAALVGMFHSKLAYFFGMCYVCIFVLLTCTPLVLSSPRACCSSLFDLDVPISSYGVKPRSNWNRAGVDYFPNVTARHLISQSSGVGILPPGENLTYDSDEYVQHITLTECHCW
jgi:CubicO group peptidase (beta-lactamase class C family)